MLLLHIGVVFLLAGDAAEASRSRHIQEQLLAPCCWNETVAEHRSEASLKMRQEIDQMVARQMPDREILDIFIQRYGRRILAEPEGNAGLVLRFMPVIAILAGLAAIAWFIRRYRPVPASTSPAFPAHGLPDIRDDDY